MKPLGLALGALLVIIVPLIAGAASPGAESLPKAESTGTRQGLKTRVEELATQLRSNQFSAREDAMADLAALGKDAVEFISPFAKSPDAEMSWRAATILVMIQWSISPKVYAAVAPLMAAYESQSWMERQETLRKVSAAGRKESIPTLIAALRADKDDRVKRTIVRILASRNMWPDGLSALREESIPGLDLRHLMDPRVLIGIGNAFLQAGNYDRALQEYERAIELQPNENVVLYNIACIYALRGEKEKAIEFLLRSIKAGYDDEEWMKRDPDLKSLHEDKRFDEMVDLIRAMKKTTGGGPTNPEEEPETEEPAE